MPECVPSSLGSNAHHMQRKTFPFIGLSLLLPNSQLEQGVLRNRKSLIWRKSRAAEKGILSAQGLCVPIVLPSTDAHG